MGARLHLEAGCDRAGAARSVWRGRVGLDQAGRTLPKLPNDRGGEAFFSDQIGSDNFIDDGDDDEPPGTESSVSKQRKDAANRVTGWCNGGMVRDGNSLVIVKAGTLGQMPHGRWASSAATGMTIGILNAGAPASDVESEWTAQIYRCDNGMNIGMTRFWPAAMVHDGTDEELVWRLVAMIPGARVERRTTSCGVIAPRAQQGEGAARLRAAPARARRGRLSIFD